MNFWERRRTRKTLLHLIKEARHIRNLREDVAEAIALNRLDAGVQRVHDVLKANNWSHVAPAATELGARIEALMPKRSWAWLRENLEIIVVALAVAMAFRTYFIQPFKIPTSSMYPTLCGIHYAPQDKPDWFDRTPLRLVKWMIFGSWYEEIRAQNSGMVQIVDANQEHLFVVNGLVHRGFEHMTDHVSNGDMVVQGQLLASGVCLAGDHIFVNKVEWNFHKPRRGEIMVFKTNGIEDSRIKQNQFYVKRMVGLPGESLGIETPYLYINDKIMAQPSGIARVEAHQFGYDGYQTTGDYLASHSNRVQLANDQFFACGDNQRNSLDSRYWGPVKRANLVGPAFFVYWPLSRRWGMTD